MQERNRKKVEREREAAWIGFAGEDSGPTPVKVKELSPAKAVTPLVVRTPSVAVEVGSA